MFIFSKILKELRNINKVLNEMKKILILASGMDLGPEQVTNGTFDTDLTGWTNVGNAVGTWESGGFMRVTPTGGSGGRYQDITGLDSSKTYRITFRARKQDTSGSVAFRLVTEPGGFSPNTIYEITETDWTDFSYDASTSTTGFRLYFQSLADGAYLDVDDVSLREIL